MQKSNTIKKEVNENIRLRTVSPKSDTNFLNDDNKSYLVLNNNKTINLNKSSYDISASVSRKNINPQNTNDNNRYIRQQVWCLDVRF